MRSLLRLFGSVITLAGVAACSVSQSSQPVPATHASVATRSPSEKGFPPGFWDGGTIPPAHNVMMFKFLNRTNGQYPDSKVFWSVTIDGVTETHSIAQQSLFDMPANSSGRIYFYLGTVGTNSNDFYDFMEYTIGPAQFNGNTTRVDAFGIKLAMKLQCADGFKAIVGENAPTFAEDRKATFARFIAAVPQPFKQLARVQAPYRIPSPGNGGFGTGGPHANYYAAYAAQVWRTNGITLPTPGPDADGLDAYPDLSAALYRHTAAPGTFSSSGQLLATSMWNSARKFYRSAPSDYYAQFWHANAVDGKAYGFPYDDVGGYSSYISHENPKYMLVAIGW
jgi:hypothetical protein